MDWRQPCVYMLACRRNGTLYIGVTSNLVGRIWQHRNEAVRSSTSHHHVHDLVWYELHETMESGILREKQLKEWKRAWKSRLIEGENPGWRDLYPTLL
ncbi:GIY-YIG nuclease family protein [Rhodanobacter sp. 7MK24]|uniref:GIY-YIG nuclease family protein n=1 Tax=Rhodanobacter sp. 7MK24 TaxID=2775922 RepID=UPI00178319EB|nr:GIY-YIG nuclease family protein [Rhodanobacter sp. 7MK24]MBD8879269.1 GIY-YIG nuclease family protein [Rhodanobacter sp. 7MK24]